MNISDRIKKFAPVEIGVDLKVLTANEKKMVDELVEAARCIDEIFLRQACSENAKTRDELKNSKKTDPALLEYFRINAGPFDRLDHDKPFIDGIGEKPAGAAFYPPDMTKKEFEDWIIKHPGDKNTFESGFAVIRRKDGKLAAIPYSEEYREWLEPAAEHLKNAAAICENKSLKKYFLSRADAFLSNDYYESDCDWVRLKNHTLEIVFGPYEVYEDKLFGYKTAFEAFVTAVDSAESERLSRVVDFLGDLEKNLPVPDEHKGIGRNLESPIVVANEIYTAGDAKKGAHGLAFNLPNDERVRKKEGSKKVMLKNVSRAKFDKILMPIAKMMMSGKDVADVDFESFFAHSLLHEVSHGIGPGEIAKDGKKTTVSAELKELYSVIEEAKADTLGVYNKIYLIEKGLYPKDSLEKLWSTYLAGFFRSIRFGIGSAHGGGNAIQFNYLLENGALQFDQVTSLCGVNRGKVGEVVKNLARDLIMIEATGNYDAAKKFIEKYRVMKPQLESSLARLETVPVDIRPIFGYE